LKFTKGIDMIGMTKKHVTDILEKYLEPSFEGGKVVLKLSDPLNYDKLVNEIVFVANASNIMEG